MLLPTRMSGNAYEHGTHSRASPPLPPAEAGHDGAHPCCTCGVADRASPILMVIGLIEPLCTKPRPPTQEAKHAILVQMA